MSFDPISLLLMATAGIGAAGSIMQGKQAAQQANYDAQIFKFNQTAANENAKVSADNARIAEENAVDAISRAQVDQLALDNEAAAFRGSQIAAQGASGLSIGGRSQVLTRAASDRIAREDALKMRQSGEYEARNFRMDARGFLQEEANYKNQAATSGMQAYASKQQAKNAKINSYFDAAATLIGAAKPTGSSLYSRPKTVQSGRASGSLGLSGRTSGTLRFN